MYPHLWVRNFHFPLPNSQNYLMLMSEVLLRISLLICYVRIVFLGIAVLLTRGCSRMALGKIETCFCMNISFDGLGGFTLPIIRSINSCTCHDFSSLLSSKYISPDKSKVKLFFSVQSKVTLFFWVISS